MGRCHRMTRRDLRGALPFQGPWRPHGKLGHSPTPHLRSWCSPSSLGVVSEKAYWGVRNENDSTLLSTTTSILESVEARWRRVTRYFPRQSDITGSLLKSLNFCPHSTIMRSITPASQASTKVMWETWIPTLIWQQ